MKIELEVYRTKDGACPYERWLHGLDAATKVRIHKAIFRMRDGNYTGCKPIKDARIKGVFERSMDFGPGWRVYYGMDGKTLVLLLTGGNKRTQARDIEKALEYWNDYKTRKDGER